MSANAAAPFGYIFYERGDRSKIGVANGQEEAVYFCTADNGLLRPECQGRPENSLIVKGEAAVPVQARWFPDASTNSIPPFVVPRTGYYCAKLVNPTRRGFNLRIEFVNPFGLLRPELYPLLVLCGALATAYVLVLAVWAVNSYRFRRVILPVQHYIALVLGLNAAEMAASYSFYSYANAHRYPSRLFLLLVILLSALRTTASLFLVLIVSLGYGTVSPTLGGKRRAVFTLAALHLAFSITSVFFMLTGRDSMGPPDALMSSLAFFLGTLPAALTHVSFYSWILQALADIRSLLGTRKQAVKKGMFDRLDRVLKVFFVVSVGMSALSIWVFLTRANDPSWFASNWHHLWLFIDGWPMLLNLGAVLALAYTWRPRANNRDFGLQQLPLDLDPADRLAFGIPDEVALQPRLPDTHRYYDERNEYRKAKTAADDSLDVGPDTPGWAADGKV